MSRLHDISVKPSNRAAGGGRSHQGTSKIEGPKLSFKKSVSNRAALLGMGLGYLGLVAILAMAPLWGQTLMGYSDAILACTEAGGSR